MDQRTALLVIDPQNDFCPGGALAVAEGDAIMPVINRLADKFSTVVVTQDWHPADHVSFAARHPGAQEFQTIELDYGTQVLWPTHCVMGSAGAALHPALDIACVNLIIRKGSNRLIDSYSAFLEADRTTRTGLHGYFSARGITHVYLCGLATDFCVAWSALDAVSFGLRATVIEDACRAIDLDGSLALAWESLAAAGVNRCRGGDLPS